MKYLLVVLTSIKQYVVNDYNDWPLRFFLEVTAWVMSIGCAVMMSITVPNPPFLILYPIFITQCLIFGWSAWTRRSFGMLANYILLVSVDLIGLVRLIKIALN